jgi:hypothetical protein
VMVISAGGDERRGRTKPRISSKPSTPQ